MAPYFKLKPRTTKDVLVDYTASVARDVLEDNKVEKDGLEFLSKLFLEDKTKEAGVKLLINVLQDPRFIEESHVFGPDLITHLLIQP